MSTTIRVSDITKRRVSAIATATGRRLTDVVDEAVEAFERRVFFDAFNSRFQELRSDEESWREIMEERQEEDGALGDGSA